MTAQARRAAQYIRMSTDRQDLSPLVQKDAIAAFARSHALEIVSSYEDQGKSGVQLVNRPRLRQLLKDVAAGAPFTEILVYDVSRWGRFQDTDAAAYYEYHCRMHGVQVIYVSEAFANDQKPASVLLKSMRRLMAAEYSRDIASKSRAGQERVVSMGFQMGALPPMGFRRCSVSADGTQRMLLQHGQRKAALTDRIQWVLAPEPEVELVRRICKAYAGGLALDEIANLVNVEGWHSAKGYRMSTQSVKRLLQHEALIGNFVWGVKSKGGKIITDYAPTRRNGCLPRIIEDDTWAIIQRRINAESTTAHCPGVRAALSTDRPRRQRPVQLKLFATSSRASDSFRRTVGSPQELRDHCKELGRALASSLAGLGMSAAFDPRTHVMSFWGTRVRIRLMWPCANGTWLLERNRCKGEVQHVLVARMSSLYRPLDFLMMPAAQAHRASNRLLERDLPRDLRRFWCKSAQELVSRLSNVGESSSHTTPVRLK